MTQFLYLSRIKEVLPDLSINAVQTTGGQFNDDVIINQEWVFRFPRHREGVNRLIAEAALLRVIKGRLPLPIPENQLESFDPPVPGLACSASRLLPGEPLSSLNWSTAPAPAQEMVLDQLVRFLRALHAIPPLDLPASLPGAIGFGPVMDMRPMWENLYGSVREKLFSAMNPDSRRAVSEHFEAYLDDHAMQSFSPCLRHGAFRGDNILWEPTMGCCTGVINFEYTALGDPAYDLATIMTLGDEFFQQFIYRYQPLPGRAVALVARAKFYRSTFTLAKALEGLRLGDRQAYQNGMSEYI